MFWLTRPTYKYSWFLSQLDYHIYLDFEFDQFDFYNVGSWNMYALTSLNDKNDVSN